MQAKWQECWIWSRNNQSTEGIKNVVGFWWRPPYYWRKSQKGLSYPGSCLRMPGIFQWIRVLVRVHHTCNPYFNYNMASHLVSASFCKNIIIHKYCIWTGQHLRYWARSCQLLFLLQSAFNFLFRCRDSYQVTRLVHAVTEIVAREST